MKREGIVQRMVRHAITATKEIILLQFANPKHQENKTPSGHGRNSKAMMGSIA
jgi:hypothetical protein